METLDKLVCIAALLVPLHHKLEKWFTAKLVEKNKRYDWRQRRRRLGSWKRKGNSGQFQICKFLQKWN